VRIGGISSLRNRTDVRNEAQSSVTLAHVRDRLAVTRTRLTRQLHVATLPAMLHRLRPTPPDAADAPDPTDLPIEADGAIDPTAVDGTPEPGLAALPIAGITRRRMAAIVSGILAAWIVIVFVRQVGAASAATAHADEISAGNVGLRFEVASLQRELDLIGRQRYVEQQARAYGLGSPREVAFTLAPDAPALAPDAPGSAAVRVGADAVGISPLERWLTVLFGPSE
jgi:hypothetical protein